jgi:hypothetical protein
MPSILARRVLRRDHFVNGCRAEGPAAVMRRNAVGHGIDAARKTAAFAENEPRFVKSERLSP